ncbi:MAG: hypothetical protein WCV90_09060 [Candidatus Woesearchaeota archaeon]|jgi:hypothetical protein
MMTKLNSDLQTAQDAIDGQGSNNVGLKPRNLMSKKVTTPDKISLSPIKEFPSLYARIVTPEDIQFSRALNQFSMSQDPKIAVSSQLNNRINLTLDGETVQGGTRKSI